MNRLDRIGGVETLNRSESQSPEPLEVAMSFRSIVARIRSLFSPAPVAPAPVARLNWLRYTVLEAYRGRVVATGTICAESESAAIKELSANHGERLQFEGGGRYRYQGENVFTRIDRTPRAGANCRYRARNARRENCLPGIVGE